MDQDTVTHLATQAMTLSVEIAGPMLLVGLVIGLVVLGVVIVVLGPWMLGQLVNYAQNLYMSIPQLIGS
jgi:flagellar biosynthesis protein FliQ